MGRLVSLLEREVRYWERVLNVLRGTSLDDCLNREYNILPNVFFEEISSESITWSIRKYVKYYGQFVSTLLSFAEEIKTIDEKLLRYLRTQVSGKSLEERVSVWGNYMIVYREIVDLGLKYHVLVDISNDFYTGENDYMAEEYPQILNMLLSITYHNTLKIVLVNKYYELLTSLLEQAETLVNRVFPVVDKDTARTLLESIVTLKSCSSNVTE